MEDKRNAEPSSERMAAISDQIRSLAEELKNYIPSKERDIVIIKLREGCVDS